MRRIKFVVSALIILMVVLTVAGCTLPSFSFNFNTLNPKASTISTPTTTATPSPINPAFTVSTPVSTATPTVITTDSDTTNTTVSGALPNFTSIIKQVRPSVVAINTKVTSQNIFGGVYTEEGAGSGWIIDSSGLIVTNNHVVEGASDITVTLEDGRNFPADTVRADSVADLAVIRIKADNLPGALKVGDSSSLQVGDWVVAIGNSLGQGISATKGIVSALGVSVSTDSGDTLDDLIQTDAAINPGNSGGPLVNLEGEVIGINSIKVSEVGVEGMGYAISSQVAIPIINDLVKNGYVTRPWLGVSLYTVDQTAVRELNLAIDHGVLLRQVLASGPAGKAGLQRYDVITQFGDKTVNTVDELVKAIRSYQVGQTVTVTYWRGNSQNTASVILEQSPPTSAS